MEEDLPHIFHRLKKLLQSYESSLQPKIDTNASYDLWSFKEIELAGKKRKEMYFAGLIMRKTYVGFYFMPIYVETSLEEVFSPALVKLLKGKSCFHITSLDASLEKDIAKALKVGFALYKKRNWV